MSKTSNTKVILDFDGVITDLELDWTEVRNHISHILGKKIDSLNSFFEENYGSKIYFQISKVIEKYELEAVSKAPLYKDLVLFLRDLKNNNIEANIATLQTKKVVLKFLDNYSLRRYFTYIVGRELFGSKKMQLKYLINLSPRRTRIIFVDDSKRNISSCNSLGIMCIYFSRRKGDDFIKLLGKIKKNIE